MAFSFDALTQCFIKKDGFLWKVPVREISFDQKIQQEVIEHNRMPTNTLGQANVSAEGVENVFTAPAEWEIATHAKTFFSSGTGTGKVSHSAGVAHSVDEVLWDCFESGVGSFESLDQSISLNQSTWTPTNIGNNVGCWRTNSRGYVSLFPFDSNNMSQRYQGTRLNWVVKYGDKIVPRIEVDFRTDYRSLRNGANVKGGLAYYVFDTNSWDNEYGIRSRTDIRLYVPENADGSNQTVDAYIAATGSKNITISATSITTTNFVGFNQGSNRKDFLTTLKDDNYIRSEGYINPYTYDATLPPVLRPDTLGTFDMYFVTNTPAATGTAGTSSANNRLIYQEAYKDDISSYNMDHHINHTPGSYSYSHSGGRISSSHQLVLDAAHHNDYFVSGVTQGWNAGWNYASPLATANIDTRSRDFTVGKKNFSDSAGKSDGLYPPNTFVFPSKIVRNGTDFTVDGNKNWTDGSNTFNAPAVAFSINSGKLQKESLVLVTGTQLNFAGHGQVKAEGSQFVYGLQVGDQLVFASTTESTNASGGVAVGTQLGAEVRFVVIDNGYENFRSGGKPNQIKSYTSRSNPTGMVTATEVLTNDYFATFFDASTGTTHNLTRKATNKIYSDTTAEIASTTSNNRTHTLTASNSAITVGSRVTHSSLPSGAALFVTAISGTSITFHTTASFSDGDVLDIRIREEYYGLNAGEFLLNISEYEVVTAIVRHPLGTSSTSDNAASLAHSDVFSLFQSTVASKEGGRVYKLKNCVVDTATINMELDELVTITWGGFASNLLNQADDFFIQSSAPSSPSAGDIHYDLDNDLVKIRNASNSAWIDCFTEGVDSTSGYIQPKQSYLRIKQQKTLGTENLPTNPIFFNLNNFNNFSDQDLSDPVYDITRDNIDTSELTLGLCGKATYTVSGVVAATMASPGTSFTITDGTVANTILDGAIMDNVTSSDRDPAGSTTITNVSGTTITTSANVQYNENDQINFTIGTGLTGFTNNVFRKLLGTYLSSNYEGHDPTSVEFALTIDGTTYNTASGHFKGVCSANRNNTLISNLRSSTTFGDFVIVSSTIGSSPDILDDYYLQLLVCTGLNTTYDTAAELDSAKISLEIILPSQTTSIEFFPRLTSASIELSNNLEMIVPNVLGPTENVTTGHVRGKRTCTFSAGMYSDETVSDLTTYLENNGKNELYNQASFTVPSEFQVLFSFGEPANYITNTLPKFQVLSERSVLNIPSTSAGDIFETTIEGICPSGTPAVFYIPA